jgi:DNA-binding NarL/FixJ family response regulator
MNNLKGICESLDESPSRDPREGVEDNQVRALGLRHEAAKALVSNLTTREMQVLHHMIDGNSNKQIAHLLGISHRTVEHHRRSALIKLSVRTSCQAVSIGAQAGMGDCDYLRIHESTMTSIQNA